MPPSKEMSELAAKARVVFGIKIRPRDLAGNHRVGFLLDLVLERLSAKPS